MYDKLPRLDVHQAVALGNIKVKTLDEAWERNSNYSATS